MTSGTSTTRGSQIAALVGGWWVGSCHGDAGSKILRAVAIRARVELFHTRAAAAMAATTDLAETASRCHLERTSGHLIREELMIDLMSARYFVISEPHRGGYKRRGSETLS